MNKTEKIVRQFMSETMPFTYKENNDGRLMTNLANFYDWLDSKKAINYTHCCKSDSEKLRAFKRFLQDEYYLPVSNRMIDEFIDKQSS